ncbi:MAG: NAD-dependent epimerase/dehydratase family protein [Betaproteobacteria bacterium]|nr:NAD-dependent epimerase/dehydratase family protein [Betaproteobacteria bacterium]
MNVLVTGTSGCLARALLPKLCAHPDIARVTGIDLKPCAFRHDKFAAVARDIRDPGLPRLLEGADALVHLAFVVLKGRTSTAAMAAINVQGSIRLFEAAAGVERIVHLSSAAVYGHGEALTEEAPLRPLPGFRYAAHKAAVEAYLESRRPDAIRLRPHVILGPHAQPLLKGLLRQPFYVRLPDPQPMLQCVHEDDVADAIVASLSAPAAGPFNLAGPERFAFRDALLRLSPGARPLPPRVAGLALRLAHAIAGIGGEPAWLQGINRSLTLDCGRARERLHWAPQRTLQATLADSATRFR